MPELEKLLPPEPIAQNDGAFKPEFIKAVGPLSLNVTTLVVEAWSAGTAATATNAAAANNAVNDNFVDCIKPSLFPKTPTPLSAEARMGIPTNPANIISGAIVSGLALAPTDAAVRKQSHRPSITFSMSKHRILGYEGQYKNAKILSFS